MDVKTNNSGSKSELKYAAALRFKRGVDKTPVVVATGRGRIAEIILKLAEEAGVPSHVEPALAKILTKLEPGTPIPEETYQVVAQILAFIWRMDKKYYKRSED